MLWSNFQSYAVEIGVLVAIVGFLFEAQRRFNKGIKADNARNRKDMLAILDVAVEQLKRVEEQQKRDSERLTQVDERLKLVDDRLKRVEEQQKADSERLKHVEERLKHVEERQIKGEETTKGIGRSMSVLQEDIRAIWQPAIGSFFSKKSGQGSDNHQNDS